MLNKKYLVPMLGAFVLGFTPLAQAAKSPARITFDEMMKCADEAKINPLRAKCDQRFADTPITGPIEEIKMTSFGPLFYLQINKAAFVGVSRSIQCMPEKKEDIAKLETLSPGDVVTIKGRMVEASQGSVSIIRFSDCEFVEEARKEDK